MHIPYFSIYTTAFLTLSIAAMAEEIPLTPFEAHYEVFASGLLIGDAVITLKTGPQPEVYYMRSEIKPNALAQLLATGSMREEASGTWHRGIPQPTRYERVIETSKKPSKMVAAFDWANSKLYAQQDAEQKTLPLTAGILDPLSLQLLFMHDAQRGAIAQQYQLVDKTAIKTYAIRTLGEEKLPTPLGTLRTLRVQQSKPGKTRHTTFWIAPERRSALVRILQDKNGQEVLRMDIRSIRQ